VKLLPNTLFLIGAGFRRQRAFVHQCEVHIVDLRHRSPEQLTVLILEKLGRPQFEHELPEEETEGEDIQF
jgi:hypothetical protein